MNLGHPLHGGCQCGRNSYVVTIPEGGAGLAEVVFATDPIHQCHLGPLSSFLRVPLAWLASSTHAFYPDESNITIRRTYTHPSQGRSKRHFCGFCGTPISYWTEEPATEAAYISIALGSLMRDDLILLDALGLIRGNEGDVVGVPLAAVGEWRVKKKQRRHLEGLREGHEEQQEGHQEGRQEGHQGPEAEGNSPKNQKERKQSRQQIMQLLGKMAEQGSRTAAPRDWASEPLPAPVSQVVIMGSGIDNNKNDDNINEDGNKDDDKYNDKNGPTVSNGVPWLDALLAGSRLQQTGHLKRTGPPQHSAPWEVLERAVDEEEDDDEEERDGTSNASTPGGGKRKRAGAYHQATVEDFEEA